MRGSAPRSSCSTAATPAPAAATTSPSAAPTPADSPLLRRPDLLRSLVTYWQQPSVALVPVLRPVHRPDQPGAARRRGARRQRSTSSRSPSSRCRRGEVPQPWLVDRLFRNLLIDVTGNTHRAEFCIDKLYSPDGATGRLGLVEFRAFEMPPHARMSLVQQLLAARAGRALLERAVHAASWCAGAPSCTTASCCRTSSGEDLARRASATSSSAGYPFAARVVRAVPRVPLPALRHGRTSATSQLELRMALEPWHVLGEEVGSQRHGALRRLVGRAPAGAASAA